MSVCHMRMGETRARRSLRSCSAIFFFLPALLILWGGVWALPACAQLPAFSGADGAAADISGGRGGIVYHVTQLDKNYGDTAQGTLRFGLDDNNFAPGTPRTIVFDVAGTFWLGRYGAERGHNNGWDTQSRINIGSNVTIAGQTAPGPVNIMGGVVKANHNNSIIRNVTIAPGYGMRSFEKPDEDPPQLPTPGKFPDSYVYDALDISGQGIMIDHVTTLYATDETISANEFADDVTIQYTNISQGQNYPQRDAEGSSVRYTGHALGSLLQAGSDAQISVLNNLYAHQKGRLPRVGSEVGTGPFNDFRNNVFYNWFGTAGTGGGGQPSFNNFIGNFYLAGPGGDDVSQLSGPDGRRNTDDDIGITVPRSGGTSVFSGNSVTRIYADGNLRDTNKDGDPNDTSTANYSGNLQSAAYDVPTGVTLSARDAFDNVLRYMGSHWWESDYDITLGNVEAIDTVNERLVHETYTGTGKIMAWADDPFNDDPNEGVEWRSLLALRADTTTGAAPFNRPASWDSDGDGMPDFWEERHGLDFNVANNNADFDADGYTDLEEYLNDVAVWPAPKPVVWNGTNTRYAEISNWRVSGETINFQSAGLVTTSSVWQPSRYDETQINSGNVVVDAPGQHAGTLKIATSNGDTAQLAITAGWLKARDEIVIGASASAQGTLSLSGGQLFTPVLSKGASGAFAFTGGTLTAEVVTFDVLNNGGTIAPAAISDFDIESEVVTVSSDIGLTHIMGYLDMQAGILEFELAGTMADEYDRIVVDGTLFAGGTLSVSLVESFQPQAGDTFDVLDFISSSGSFLFDMPTLTGGLMWDTSSVVIDGVLSVEFVGDADFDGDGDVSGSDFLIWQRGLGMTNQLDNSNGDADGNGTVDQNDLVAWKAQFGTSTMSLNVAPQRVPEPAAWLMMLGFFSFMWKTPSLRHFADR